MNYGLDSAIRGLPAVLGVFLGLASYAKPVANEPALVPLTLLLVGVISLGLAVGAFNRSPMLGVALLEVWVVSAIALSALATQLLLWLTVSLDMWIKLPTDVEEKSVSGAIIGAASAFLASAWLKELQDGKGPFLPSSVFEKRLAKSFQKAHSIVGSNVEFELCDSEHVAKLNIDGWGLTARWRRAIALNRFLKCGKSFTQL